MITNRYFIDDPDKFLGPQTYRDSTSELAGVRDWLPKTVRDDHYEPLGACCEYSLPKRDMD